PSVRPFWRASRSGSWVRPASRVSPPLPWVRCLNYMLSSGKTESRSTRSIGGLGSYLEGREMIRRMSLLLAGALMGASVMSLVYGTNGTVANAAGSETYRQLAIFGDIFERVRAQYVTPPDE